MHWKRTASRQSSIIGPYTAGLLHDLGPYSLPGHLTRLESVLAMYESAYDLGRPCRRVQRRGTLHV